MQSTDKKHLLIVDDEPVILQILKAVFEEEPWRLTLVGTGSEAKRILEAERVDLLLTDKNLPDVSGLELLRIAKAREPLCEVIILTGYGSLETALAAMELDAFDYVLKPLNNVFDIRKKARQAFAKQDVALENRRLILELREKNSAVEAALEETRALQAELIQSEKLAGIGTLAAGIAHEISSPLFGIMGLAEAIADEPDLPLAQSYARDIVEYCRSVRDIVVELSSYSRAASNEYLTTVELTRVIHDALRLVERSSDVRNARFETNVEPELFLNARTNEIQQVFVNLVKNAAEAVNELEGGGVVRISAGRTGNTVWATVSDTGPGIDVEKQRIIFDPFYTTKAPGKGTGLGLNIVYRIVTKYRGTITVDSRPGQGALFELRFPVER
ncbi:hybrid sensor histidine kinase/response regulator [Deltaproteobacteria bacterium]|nr:hybrid sensor histidine kinase/response regulator [Deltaproteobacteria bacterium]